MRNTSCYTLISDTSIYARHPLAVSCCCRPYVFEGLYDLMECALERAISQSSQLKSQLYWRFYAKVSVYSGWCVVYVGMDGGMNELNGECLSG